MGFVVKVRRLKLQCIATAWAPAGFFSRGWQIKGLETKVRHQGPGV